MDKNQVEQRAYDLFQSGFNCAEAITTSIVEWRAEGLAESAARSATPFGGGVGGTKCETCGALTGGVIALGLLFGRTEPEGDKQDAYALAAEFRNRFLDTFGATQCKAILDAFGKQEDLQKCKRMTGAAAGIMYDILQQEKNGRSEAAPK